MDAATPHDRPRVLFLSAFGAPHAHLAHALIQQGCVTHVLKLLDSPNPSRPSLVRRVLAHPWKSVSSKIRELVLNPHLASIDDEVRAAFAGGDSAPEESLSVPVHEVPTWQVNAQSTAHLLRELKPDVILVSGAPMLRRHIFEIPTRGTVNVHWGIAPAYRGGHTLFWALYNRDASGIGYTVHKVAQGSDTGDVYWQRIVMVPPTATESDCWIACVRDAAQSIPPLVPAIADGSLSAAPQKGMGTLYRYGDRTLWKQVRYLLFRRGRPWDPTFRAGHAEH